MPAGIRFLLFYGIHDDSRGTNICGNFIHTTYRLSGAPNVRYWPISAGRVSRKQTFKLSHTGEYCQRLLSNSCRKFCCIRKRNPSTCAPFRTKMSGTPHQLALCISGNFSKPKICSPKVSKGKAYRAESIACGTSASIPQRERRFLEVPS